MKTLLRAALLAAGSISIFSQTKPVAKPASASASVSVEQTIMQLEREWGQAQIKKDFAAIDKIIANDWMGIDYDGNTFDKPTVLEHMKSGASTLESEDISGMKVRVFGNTAVVTGIDVEKSKDRGKDSSGKYVWTDVFVLRNGRWQVVATQSTKMN